MCLTYPKPAITLNSCEAIRWLYTRRISGPILSSVIMGLVHPRNVHHSWLESLNEENRLVLHVMSLLEEKYSVERGTTILATLINENGNRK